MNLLEAYKDRLAISERAYSKIHLGESMSTAKKLATAKCLHNINKFLNEAFENSVGTQRSDMGLWKKFTLNLTTVALPNLIAFDLVIVHPMSSMSGYITYVEYTAGSNKGSTEQGHVFNSVFKLGDVDINYTSDKVVDTLTEDYTYTEGTSGYKLSWTPIRKGTFDDNGTKKDVKIIGANGDVTYANVDGDDRVEVNLTTGDRVIYLYDNIIIPQNDLPTWNAEIKNIALTAKARRIAIYYSQMAAYQAKTDYGFDLGDQLAEKAVGQLAYEIDTEITQLLIDQAEQDPALVWSKTLPFGVSKQDHYDAFTEIIENGRKIIYDRTKKFIPNYILIASDILPIFNFIKGFTPATAGQVNGPYFAGTLGAYKVFVTPNIEQGKFVIGVNGNDMMSSAAVYAPYMPVVPTQLLGFADGAMSQGYSTLYDLKLLNKYLVVAGRITA